MVPGSNHAPWAALGMLVLVAGCSGNVREVVGEPPQTGIDGLVREASGVVVELALRNVNDEALELAAIEIELTLDDLTLTSGSRESPLTVSARGREVVRLSLPANEPALERLDDLSDPGVASLRWQLEVDLTTDGGRKHNTRTSGWLHPVPGQPGRYR